VSDDDRRAEAGLHRTIPALPARDVRAAVAYYRERFGFEAPHETDDFAVIVRADAVIHLWGATDDDWRHRDGFAGKPICSGAESFIAGTASCRIETRDVDALYEELREHDVLHPVSREGISDSDFGTREFATRAREGNLVTFFRWVA
jgi:catechol 2,3-dioxygenase-like lactoylglutathione lyase family enzyme